LSEELAARVASGDRRALAQAITLAESTRAEHRLRSEEILAELLPKTGGAHRVAITGLPGAGKSTLLDALGMVAVERARRVAILAVDPASAITGGSVLGDVVRMQRLAARAEVFLRASSNAAALGGTAPASREAVLLCEAAGFDLVLLETVGVGQAEQGAADVSDTLVALTLADAGDDVQGMKRGLIEVAHAVIVNKADGDLQSRALSYAAELAAALALLRAGAAPHVAAVSAKSERGVAELFDWLTAREAELRQGGELERLRREQALRALHRELGRVLLERACRADRVLARLPALESAVAEGRALPSAAARELCNALFSAKS
jgi:LAO/AO transport system kinase